MVRNPPTNARDVKRPRFDPWVERPLRDEMATHSSILARRIPWTEEPGGLQPKGLQRVRHDWSHLANIQSPRDNFIVSVAN